MKLFWDANILLDLFDKDRDDHTSALSIFNCAAASGTKHLCAWHSLSILHYILNRKYGSDISYQILQTVIDNYELPATGTSEARNAMTHDSGDYEDAMQIAAALKGQADYLITRDLKGFQKSPIPVLTPVQFLKKHS